MRRLMRFLWKEKIWWMVPMGLMLAALLTLVYIARSSPVAPFVYTLF